MPAFRNIRSLQRNPMLQPTPDVKLDCDSSHLFSVNSPTNYLIEEPPVDDVGSIFPRPIKDLQHHRTPVLPPNPPAPARNSHARKRSPGHIPRPRNAFLIYRSDLCLQRRVTDSVGNRHGEVSQIAGQLWNSLSEAEKAPYRLRALDEKMEHERMYPGYRYTPGSRGSDPVKRSLGRPKSTKCSGRGVKSTEQSSSTTAARPKSRPEIRTRGRAMSLQPSKARPSGRTVGPDDDCSSSADERVLEMMPPPLRQPIETEKQESMALRDNPPTPELTFYSSDEESDSPYTPPPNFLYTVEALDACIRLPTDDVQNLPFFPTSGSIYPCEFTCEPADNPFPYALPGDTVSTITPWRTSFRSSSLPDPVLSSSAEVEIEFTDLSNLMVDDSLVIPLDQDDYGASTLPSLFNDDVDTPIPESYFDLGADVSPSMLCLVSSPLPSLFGDAHISADRTIDEPSPLVHNVNSMLGCIELDKENLILEMMLKYTYMDS